MGKKQKIKKIAVLTSGGDAPGMNAAIRAVVRSAIANNIEVYGIKNGFKGLVNDDFYVDSSTILKKLISKFSFLKKHLSEEMTSDSVSQIIGKGGTILGTSRFPEFQEESVRKVAIDNLRKRGINALVVIGGNGSYMGAWKLSEEAPDIQVIGIPATIDNDVEWTDKTIGFATAANTLSKVFDKIRDTARSHNRVFLVSAMGRDAGDLALVAGITCGAEAILIPEVSVDDKLLKYMIDKKLSQGRDYAIIVAAEGVATVDALSKKIEAMGFDTRTSDIGHAQRGGSPCVEDRLLASNMGSAAVDLIIKGVRGVALSTNGRSIYHISLKKIFTQKDNSKLTRKKELYKKYQKITYGEVLIEGSSILKVFLGKKQERNLIGHSGQVFLLTFYIKISKHTALRTNYPLKKTKNMKTKLIKEGTFLHRPYEKKLLTLLVGLLLTYLSFLIEERYELTYVMLFGTVLIAWFWEASFFYGSFRIAQKIKTKSKYLITLTLEHSMFTNFSVMLFYSDNRQELFIGSDFQQKGNRFFLEVKIPENKTLEAIRLIDEEHFREETIFLNQQ